jgi:hypothetical protein
MIYGVTTDTAEPRNLHDWELSKDMAGLPPSRPPEEATPIAYTITMARLLGALGKIVRYLSALQPVSYEVVVQLDNDLLQSHLKVPPHLLMRRRLGTAEDHESLDHRRTQFEFLYRQGACMLHRKFFTQSRIDARYSLSRQRCVELPIMLLQMQNMFYDRGES